MTKEELKEKLNCLSEIQFKKLEQCQNTEEWSAKMQEIFGEKINAKDLLEIIMDKSVTEAEPLSDEDLEKVAGGTVVYGGNQAAMLLQQLQQKGNHFSEDEKQALQEALNAATKPGADISAWVYYQDLVSQMARKHSK